MLMLFLPAVLDSVCWTQENDVHGFGRISYGFATVYQCQSACINDSACVAIDWEPSNTEQSCWILTSTAVGDAMNTGVIAHYELNRANIS